jgi:ATP-dependent Lhr-like helicase
MAHLGLVASDNWSGLRPYFGPDRRAAKELGRRDRSGASQPGVSAGGRWFLFPPVLDELSPDERLEQWAWLLLRRWGVVFFDLMTKERLAPPWRDTVKVLRRLEARGQIRGGRFISGVGGEQYALPGIVEALRAHKSLPSKSEVIVVSAADPLNLFGIITPDQRIPATRGNRVAIFGGKLIGWRMGGHIEVKPGLPPEDEAMVTRALRLTGVFRRQDPFLREWQQQKSRPSSVPQDLRLKGNFR